MSIEPPNKSPEPLVLAVIREVAGWRKSRVGGGLAFFGSMRALLTFLSPVMLLGCSQQHFTPPSVSKSDSEPFSDMRLSGDSRFSAEEQRIVTAARVYLEKSRQKPLDARYRVERTRAGYEVFAMFVAGYENGRPLYYPGGHGTVIFHADGSFDRYLLGM